MSTSQKPRRPALQINTAQVPSSRIASSRKVAMVDPKDPTAFNTLSNVYATVVDRSTPVEPVTAINTRQPLRIQTGDELKSVQSRTQTPYAAFAPSYPETPLTANPRSPMNNPEFIFPSTMTATPPMSAGPVDNQLPTFTFTPADTGAATATATAPGQRLSLNTALVSGAAGRPVEHSPRTPRRSRTLPASTSPPLPYTHPRTLHSILRNSPLPPLSSKTPISPRRQSLRLQEKAAKRVCYNNPLTQTITNSKYIFSHVDLLAEDASPSPMSPAVPEAITPYADSNETRDGGMTPGPMEDIRRRMACLTSSSSPLTTPGGIRKRKKKDRKRQWTWTINQEEDDEDVGGAIAAIRAAEAAKASANSDKAEQTKMEASSSPPQSHPLILLQPNVYVPPQVHNHDRTPSLDSQDVEMSDSSSLMSEDSLPEPGHGMDIDDLTPMVERKDFAFPAPVLVRRSSVGGELTNQVRGDSPVPPNLLA